MVDPPETREQGEPIAFVPSPERTIGIEMEVSLVDPATGALVPKAKEILEALDGDANVKPELFQSIVEVNTGVCHTVAEARSDLAARLARVREVAREMGCELICTGTHPMTNWSEVPISPDARYLGLVDRMRWPARRLLICGIHVHVGVPSGEHAIALTNALSCFIPHFLALSASSPFWAGRDTGLASSRSKIFEGLPTAGLPPRLTNWAEFVTLMRTLLSAQTITSIREVWWDIRPHPNFGTIELRMCDGMNTLSEIAAVTALAQSMVEYLVNQYDTGEPLPEMKRWTLAENRWRAARFAIDADIIRNERGDQIPLRQHIREWVDHLVPTAQSLGCEAELKDVLKILDHGPSYRRQRAWYESHGDVAAVVQELVGELKHDAPWRHRSMP